MNVYLVTIEHDYDPTEMLGAFASLDGAKAFINTLDEVEPLAEDEYDEYDPKTQITAYWVDGKLARIHELLVNDDKRFSLFS